MSSAKPANPKSSFSSFLLSLILLACAICLVPIVINLISNQIELDIRWGLFLLFLNLLYSGVAKYLDKQNKFNGLGKFVAITVGVLLLAINASILYQNVKTNVSPGSEVPKTNTPVTNQNNTTPSSLPPSPTIAITATAVMR